MGFKELFDKSVDFIDSKRKSIITISLVGLGIILLAIVFFVSSDELSVSKEANVMIQNIENRKYNIASNYYSDLEKDFSKSKMDRFNNAIAKKINRLLLVNGDKYISGQITKEHYAGLINMINSLEGISMDVKKMVDQAKRVSDMYSEENLDYDIAISYINTASSLNSIGNELSEYKQNIEVINDSRVVYEKAVKNEQIKNYYEAIEDYKKVIPEDKKYYNQAQKGIDNCVDEMYDYYIEKADESNENGDYEKALEFIQYLKPYYPDDEEVLNLEKKYKKNLSLYTLSSEDILNLISKRSGKEKESLEVSSFQQMINKEKYYYVEVYQYDKLVDELFIDPKTKKIYSHKDNNKDYKSTYVDGYFKILEDGNIKFAISEGEAKFILENKLTEKGNKFKSISIISEDKVDSYIKGMKTLDEAIGKKRNTYYYGLVHRGIFKQKQLYVVDMYSKKVYSITDDGLKQY